MWPAAIGMLRSDASISSASALLLHHVSVIRGPRSSIREIVGAFETVGLWRGKGGAPGKTAALTLRAGAQVFAPNEVYARVEDLETKIKEDADCRAAPPPRLSVRVGQERRFAS